MRAALVSPDPTAADRYEAERGSKLSGGWQRRLALVRKNDPKRADAIAAELLSNRAHRGHSGEYGSLIIHSAVTGQPRVIYGNVTNDGLIANLPPDCCVEVPCLVDKNGIQPTKIGAIPSQLAALMQTNINVQRLTVEAALTRKKERIYQAAMLDPHTAAELNLDQIWSLVDDLIAAHGDMLPTYD